MKIDMNECIFKKKRIKLTKVILFTILISLIFMMLSDFQIYKVIAGIGKIGVFFKQYFPPKFTDFHNTLKELWITIIVSIGSTVFAAVFSFFMSLFTCKSMALNETLGKIFTGIGLLYRNIPIYVWQLLLGMIFYMGGFFLAFLIILLISLGFLVRAFTEVIDESSSSSIEALKSTGAGKLVIIKNAIIPDTMAQLVSWTLFCIETNIRSSALIGYLTGSGIGYLISFHRGYKRDFNTTLGLVIIIAITLILWDLTSNKLRGIILSED
ncbi:MAG: PhnE/PtxC family ABC transporter permease [Fusobacteriaceae bacterium]